MSVNSGSGPATGRELKREKKKIAFAGVAWVPVKPPPKDFVVFDWGDGVEITLCSTATTGIYATRSGGFITLSYSLKASRPIIYVTVTIQDASVAIASAPRTVPTWCLDLGGSASTYVKLDDTTVDFGLFFKDKPVLIKLTYDTTIADDAGALETTADPP